MIVLYFLLGLLSLGAISTFFLGKATSDIDYGDWEEIETNNRNAYLNATHEI